MKRFWGLIAGVVMILALAGCQSEVTVSKVSASERKLYNMALPDMTQPAPETMNLLGNFLLLDMYRDDPQRLLLMLEKLFRAEPRDLYLVALADVALHAGFREATNSDMAMRFFLSSAVYSYDYLRNQDNTANPYNTERLTVMRLYNIAIGELYTYLKKRDMERKSNFELTTATGQTVFFRPPHYRLPVPQDKIQEFLLCADFRPHNFTHNSRNFGMGAPLIADLADKNLDPTERFAANQMIPATLIIRFSSPWKKERLAGGLKYLDSRNINETKVGGRQIPLASDFSTPLAYMVQVPPLLGHIERTIFPELSQESEGLYHLEPYSDQRIPIVLVHGLMSDIRTWIQLINTLQNDPDIRDNYQFLGFSYSSGNTIFVSAYKLRQALQHAREKMVKMGHDTKKFDQMILIGHSMGGLLSRLQISYCDNAKLREIITPETDDELRRTLPPEEIREIEKISNFKPLPFVKRVVYISVPHRGAELASTWVGRLGSSLVQLPRQALRYNHKLFERLRQSKKISFKVPDHPLTGIDNLAQDDTSLKVLNSLEQAKIPVHSIIGNTKKQGIPGGTDGIVPYSSSHLDNAKSELVVKSGHSAQRNPLAIQELRRILLLHLKSQAK